MSQSEDIFCAVCGTQKGCEKGSYSQMLDNEEWVCGLKCWKDYALEYFHYPSKEDKKQIKKQNKAKSKLCPSCGVNKATKPHSCPYSEIDHDEKECTCCPECEKSCNQEI